MLRVVSYAVSARSSWSRSDQTVSAVTVSSTTATVLGGVLGRGKILKPVLRKGGATVVSFQNDLCA